MMIDDDMISYLTYPNICYDVNSHPLLLFVCFGVCTHGVQIHRKRRFSFAGRLEGGDEDISSLLFIYTIK